jgi:glycosyltransferase involved in cell wall biosynthesis
VLWLVKGLGRGGAEKLLTLMAPRIDRDRFDLEVAYLLSHHDDVAMEIQRQGVPTRCLGSRRTLGPRWVVGLGRLLRRERYDLVHTHSPLPAAAARLLVPSSTRLVHTDHNQWSAYHPATRLANAATYARNDAVIAVSDAVKSSINTSWWMPGRRPSVETLHHGVEPTVPGHGADARRAARQVLGLRPESPVVGMVANLSAKKDHAGLLAAFDRVRREVDDVTLLLVGSGPLEGLLRADVEARGLKDRVRLLGTRDDVAALLPALDVFVLATRHEGLPLSLLEAMGAGVACVATAVGGVPEIITDGLDGRLVPVADPGALADAITAMLREPEARHSLAAAGIERVRTGFSIDRAAVRVQQIYTEVLDAGPVRP